MNRKGVTLLEILLVVAVIAVMASLTLPLWSGMLESEKVSRAGDIVRAKLGLARVRAIREGEEYCFCYFPESGQYWIEPLRNSIQANAMASGNEPTDKLALPPSNYLPQGVTFTDGQTQETIRSVAAEEEEGTVSYQRIIFFPDGSAQTAGILLTNEFGDAVQVTVRGITGSTSASDYIID